MSKIKKQIQVLTKVCFLMCIFFLNHLHLIHLEIPGSFWDHTSSIVHPHPVAIAVTLATAENLTWRTSSHVLVAGLYSPQKPSLKRSQRVKTPENWGPKGDGQKKHRLPLGQFGPMYVSFREGGIMGL